MNRKKPPRASPLDNELQDVLVPPSPELHNLALEVTELARRAQVRGRFLSEVRRAVDRDDEEALKRLLVRLRAFPRGGG